MKHFRQMENIGGEPAEINMSPLVDMVFLLLIFFMVTTVFVQETGVDVTSRRPPALNRWRRIAYCWH
jgi:biopolymer transport protein ExbD